MLGDDTKLWDAVAREGVRAAGSNSWPKTVIRFEWLLVCALTHAIEYIADQMWHEKEWFDEVAIGQATWFAF